MLMTSVTVAVSFVSIHQSVHCRASQPACQRHQVHRSQWLPEFTYGQVTVMPPISTRVSLLVLHINNVFVHVFVLFSIM